MKNRKSHRLTSRLSRNLPQNLVRLANQPSIGLNHLATHAQRRATPALANISHAISLRNDSLSESILDARDASDTLSQHGPTAQASLKRISAMLHETQALVEQLTPPS